MSRKEITIAAIHESNPKAMKNFAETIQVNIIALKGPKEILVVKGFKNLSSLYNFEEALISVCREKKSDKLFIRETHEKDLIYAIGFN